MERESCGLAHPCMHQSLGGSAVPGEFPLKSPQTSHRQEVPLLAPYLQVQ